MASAVPCCGAGDMRDGERAVAEKVMALLEVFSLGDLRDEPATSLPYGAQRRLEIVRALATDPKLLLLDEPAAGMNPSEKEELMRLIEFIRGRFGMAILLVEHDMQVVMGICGRIVVLEYGMQDRRGLAGGMSSAIPRCSKPISAPATRPSRPDDTPKPHSHA